MTHLDDNAVAAFVGGTLGPDARAEVERHIETCASCRGLVVAMLKGAREDQSLSSADTLPQSKPLSPTRPRGTQLGGRYVVIEAIGAGGMGVVYSAYDPVLERKVAVKLVHAARSTVEDVKERLLREGKSIAQLSHPNIVAVFDMGTSDAEVFIAMELVEGGSLKQWLKADKRSWREVLDKFVDAGEGLAAAHRAGLVHRDFKPENVLVGADGRVRVTDFGLASSAGVAPPSFEAGPPGLEAPRLTRSGTVMGTPAYMAPEQHGGAEARAHSDQFSFCVALWEGLYGARPYGQGWRFVEPPADAGVPPWLERALRRGLSTEPAARFASLEDLLIALQTDPDRPRRRRMRRLIISGAGLALLAASTYVAATRNDRLCTGAQARVDAVWSAPIEDRIRSAFAKTGVEGAAANWELARARLDSWWRAWAEMHTEACRATRVRGEQSDQVLGLRMACLDRRHAEATALLSVFERADRDVTEQAPVAVDALTSLQHCANAEALLQGLPPPEDPVVRASVDQVRAMLAVAKAQQDLGRYQNAETGTAAALKLAERLRYKPALAEAQLMRGRLQEHLGDLKGAEATLLEAISAGEAGKHDAITAEAATVLVQLLGARQARYSEAHAWEKLAEGAIGRVGGDPALKAHLLQASGLVRYAEGKLPDAVDAHQQAVELLEKVEPDSLALAEAYNGLAAAHRGGRRAKEALAAYERALGILLQRVGPDSDLVATTRNGIANAYLLDGRFGDALALYQQAYAVQSRRLGPTHFRTVTTLNNIGVVLAEQTKYAEALPYFEQVLEARKKTAGQTDAKTADAYSNVGMLLVELQRWDDAARSFEQARGILQGYPLDHFSQAEPLLGAAKLSLAKGDPAKAVAPVERVLVLCEKKEGFRFDYTRARARFLLGRALYADSKRAKEGHEHARAARDAFAGFGAERFARDLAEVDAWLAAHPEPK